MMIHGEKGGSSPPPPPPPAPSPVEAANTLASVATVDIVDLLCCGPIAGLVTHDGRSVFLDETPLQRQDLGYNFQYVTWDKRYGWPDQPAIPYGVPIAETYVAVGTEVRLDHPVTRTITDAAVTAIRLVIRVPRLTVGDAQGNIFGGRVDLGIHLGSYGNNPGRIATMTIEGKCTTPYEREIYIRLPPGGDPWTLRINRDTPDAGDSYTSNQTIVSGYTELVEEAGSHPNMALVFIRLDAREFAQMPRRSYLVSGLVIPVPSNRMANYDVYPPQITYEGIWDGSFKQEWCPNPAWILWDLATNGAYGMGLPEAQVDKWAMYDISRWCDELVPNGRGGLEVRHECHLCLNSQQDAYQVLSDIASSFHGAPVWAGSVLTFIADMPRDVDMLVNQASVIDGVFSYREEDLPDVYNTIYVTWSDRDSQYRPAIEVVADHADVAARGEVRKDIIAPGCTSRSMAHRYGRWYLDTAKNSRGIVSYRAGLDHAGIGPGMIIEIADPAWAGARHGGRVRASTPNTLTLDAEVTLEAGGQYTLAVMADDLTPMSMPVLTGAGTWVVLEINGTWPKNLLQGAVWALSGGTVATTLWRVVAMVEVEPHIVEVTAVHHDPNKYARIDNGTILPEPSTSLLPDITDIPVPTGLSVNEGATSTLEGGLARYIDVSWELTSYPYLRHYQVQWRRENGNWESLAPAATPPARIEGVRAGVYQVRLQAVSILQHRGPWAELEHEVPWGAPIALAPVSGLEIKGQGHVTEFSGPDVHLSWWDASVTGNIVGDHPLGVDAGMRDASLVGYRVVVSDPESGAEIHSELVEATNYTFSLPRNAETSARAGLAGPLRRLLFTVRPVDSYNRTEDATAVAAIEAYNPPPEVPADLMVTAIEGAIRLTCTAPGDIDYMGVRVYAAREGGFAPNPAAEGNMIHQGAGSPLVIPVAAGIWYVRVEPYDAFGRVGLNISGEMMLDVPASLVRIASMTQMGRLFPLPGSAFWRPPGDIATSRLLRVEAEVGQAPIGRDLIAHLLLDGVLIAAITITDGNLVAAPVELGIDMANASRLTVDLIQVGSMAYGMDLRVKVFWRPEVA